MARRALAFDRSAAGVRPDRSDLQFEVRSGALRPRIDLLWLLTVLAGAILGGSADVALADGGSRGSEVIITAMEQHQGDVLVQPENGGPQDRPVLAGAGCVLTAVEPTRRKPRNPERTPVQALSVTTRAVTDDQPRSIGYNSASSEPIAMSPPRRPFLPQAPPSPKTTA